MKTLKFASIGFLIGFLLAQFSCNASAQDYKYSRDYSIENFDRIHLEGGYKVLLIQGERPALTIETSDEDAFDYYNIDSDFSELSVTMKDRHFHFEKLTLYITFTELEEISIEGGVKLETRGYVNLDDLYLSVEGGGKIDMNMKAHDIKVVCEGGMLLEFEGIANSFNAHVSGAAHVDAGNLEAKEVTVRIEGVGTCGVFATDELWANIEGVGKIKYHGDPRVHKSVEGIGTVSRD
ncbi:MAG: DUF2807 domain-containing protein [Prolixibacteraceae bacterium]|nr:DUF2807 domain-containing protein [Prolixibacteraceae bacterium]MBN2775795.1 DUF2807 domain-containing protein [Prolixibacteraceae bacterium]